MFFGPFLGLVPGGGLEVGIIKEKINTTMRNRKEGRIKPEEEKKEMKANHVGSV